MTRLVAAAPEASLVLALVRAGWEVVAGGTFVTNDFWTALQDEPEPSN